MARGRVELSPGEWAVLGVVSEQPTHGFAVAQLLADTGELGQVWSVQRPMVYEALKKLLALGLLREQGTERTGVGPARTIVAATPRGRRALRGWLVAPVDHVRDVRSMLLLKLALLARAGGDPLPLLGAQEARLRPQLESLTRVRDRAEGFDRVLAEWRLESSRATQRFLQRVAANHARQHRDEPSIHVP
ncbi:MAG TPA: helix-turn-helix transcriptional regulator [Nocardioidaceae bacterium]|nr:helix-turn-helix transcriptional regulator [Nocardioidaceae bacterium]